MLMDMCSVKFDISYLSAYHLPKYHCTAPRKKFSYSDLFWFECGKIRTRITPNKDTFYAVLLTELKLTYVLYFKF